MLKSETLTFHNILPEIYKQASRFNPFQQPKLRRENTFISTQNFTHDEKKTICFSPAANHYRPQTKLREGYIFTPVCNSVHRGGVSQHASQVT